MAKCIVNKLMETKLKYIYLKLSEARKGKNEHKTLGIN